MSIEGLGKFMVNEASGKNEAVQLAKGAVLRRATARDSRAMRGLVKELGWTLRQGKRLSFLEAVPTMGTWVMIGLVGGWLGWVLAQGLVMVATIGLSLAMLLWGLVLWNPLIHWSEYWVVVVGQQVVACAKLSEGEETSELYDVFVGREWRGLGFGQALVQAAIAEARYPVYLASLPDAIGFYEALGFRVIGGTRLDLRLRGRLSLENPHYQKLGLTPMVRSGVRSGQMNL